MTLERSKSLPERFEYLGLEDSKTYERALAGDIDQATANTLIVLLLEKIAHASRAAHVNWAPGGVSH